MSSPAVVPRNAAVNTSTLNTTLPTSGFPATLIAGGSSTDVMGRELDQGQNSTVLGAVQVVKGDQRAATGFGPGTKKRAPQGALFKTNQPSSSAFSPSIPQSRAAVGHLPWAASSGAHQACCRRHHRKPQEHRH